MNNKQSRLHLSVEAQRSSTEILELVRAAELQAVRKATLKRVQEQAIDAVFSEEPTVTPATTKPKITLPRLATPKRRPNSAAAKNRVTAQEVALEARQLLAATFGELPQPAQTALIDIYTENSTLHSPSALTKVQNSVPLDAWEQEVVAESNQGNAVTALTNFFNSSAGQAMVIDVAEAGEIVAWQDVYRAHSGMTGNTAISAISTEPRLQRFVKNLVAAQSQSINNTTTFSNKNNSINELANNGWSVKNAGFSDGYARIDYSDIYATLSRVANTTSDWTLQYETELDYNMHANQVIVIGADAQSTGYQIGIQRWYKTVADSRIMFTLPNGTKETIALPWQLSGRNTINATHHAGKIRVQITTADRSKNFVHTFTVDLGQIKSQNIVLKGINSLGIARQRIDNLHFHGTIGPTASNAVRDYLQTTAGKAKATQVREQLQPYYEEQLALQTAAAQPILQTIYETFGTLSSPAAKQAVLTHPYLAGFRQALVAAAPMNPVHSTTKFDSLEEVQQNWEVLDQIEVRDGTMINSTNVPRVLRRTLPVASDWAIEFDVTTGGYAFEQVIKIGQYADGTGGYEIRFNHSVGNRYADIRVYVNNKNQQAMQLQISFLGNNHFSVSHTNGLVTIGAKNSGNTTQILRTIDVRSYQIGSSNLDLVHKSFYGTSTLDNLQLQTTTTAPLPILIQQWLGSSEGQAMLQTIEADVSTRVEVAPDKVTVLPDVQTVADLFAAYPGVRTQLYLTKTETGGLHTLLAQQQLLDPENTLLQAAWAQVLQKSSTLSQLKTIAPMGFGTVPVGQIALQDWLHTPNGTAFVQALSDDLCSESVETLEQQPQLWVDEITARYAKVIITNPGTTSVLRVTGSMYGDVRVDHSAGAEVRTVFIPLAVGTQDRTITMYDAQGAQLYKVDTQWNGTAYTTDSFYTWDAAAYAAMQARLQNTLPIDGDTPYSVLSEAATLALQDSAGALVAVSQHWGETWHDMQQVKTSSSYGNINPFELQFGGLMWQHSTHFITYNDFMANVYASRPDVFTPNGSHQPGMLYTWQTMRANAVEQFAKQDNQISALFKLANNIVTRHLNGFDTTNDYQHFTQQTAWWQAYMASGGIKVQSGTPSVVHSIITPNGMLQEVMRIVESESYAPQKNYYLEQTAIYLRNLNEKNARNLWWFQNKERILLANAQIRGAETQAYIASLDRNQPEDQAKLDAFYAASAAEWQTIYNKRAIAAIQNEADTLTSRSALHANIQIARAVAASTGRVVQIRTALGGYNNIIDVSTGETIARYNETVIAAAQQKIAAIMGTANLTGEQIVVAGEELVAGIGGAVDEIMKQTVAEQSFNSGGDINVSSSQQLSLVRAWFAESSTYITGVRSDTFISQLYHGALYKMNQANSNWATIASITNIIGRIIDYDGSVLLQSIRAGSGNVLFDVRSAKEYLRSFFITAGYGNIFSNASVQAGSITTMDPNKDPSDLLVTPTYEAAQPYIYRTGETIRVRLDVAEAGDIRFHNAHLYAIVNGVQTKFLGLVTSYGTTGELYLECKASEIMSYLNSSAATNYQTVGLKIAVWFTKPNISGEYTSVGVTKNVWVEVPTQLDLSTNANIDARARENVILNQIQLPVQKGLGWYNLLGSGYHEGKAWHAVDLNYGTIGADDGALIYAVDDGKVIEIVAGEGKTTIVSLLHTDSQGNEFTSTIMHQRMEDLSEGKWAMLDKNNNRITTPSGEELTVSIGKIFTKGDILAHAGGESNFPTHVHFAIYAGNGRNNQNAINLDGYLQNDKIETKVSLGTRGLAEVSFDTSISQWVVRRTDSNNTVIDEKVFTVPEVGYTSAGFKIYNYKTYAWHVDPSQRHEVRWASIIEKDHPKGIFRWRAVSNLNRFWNGIDWEDSIF